MNRSRLFWVFPLAALLIAGCDKAGGGESAGGSSATPAKSARPGSGSGASSGGAAPSSSTAERRGGRHSRGMAGMFFRAAERGANLPDDKKAELTKMEAPLLTYDPTQRAEWKTFHADLVAGAKDGKLDTAKLSTDEAALEKEMESRRDQESQALTDLHNALDPTQRKAVTAAIRQFAARREKEHAAAPAPSGSAPAAAPSGSSPAARAENREKRHLDHLTKDLDLDAAQAKSVAAILAKSDQADWESMQAERRKRMESLLTAFEGDSFDAKALVAKETPDKPHVQWDKQVQFLAQLVPLLHPIQRDKLAQSMEHGRWTINARGERTMGDAPPPNEHGGREEEERP